MGSKSGVALRALQFFIRFIQFCTSIIILGIVAYFLSTLHNHGLYIARYLRATEGLAGLAAIFSFLAMLFLCCLPGHPIIATLFTILDLAFFGSFIYIAVAHRAGAGSCSGSSLNTPFGRGAQNASPTGSDGFTRLPTYGMACRLQKAVYAIAIIGLIFFLFSIIAEWLLVRNRKKEKHAQISQHQNAPRRRGFLKRSRKGQGNGDVEGGQQLRGYTGDVGGRTSYATGDTAIGSDYGMAKHGQNGGHQGGHESGNGYQEMEGGAHHNMTNQGLGSQGSAAGVHPSQVVR